MLMGYQKKVLTAFLILIDFVFKIDKNYYPQVFLEECRYIDKEKKVIRYITDDLEISSNDSHKKNMIKKIKN